jgi:hypothetical protein
VVALFGAPGAHQAPFKAATVQPTCSGCADW